MSIEKKLLQLIPKIIEPTTFVLTFVFFVFFLFCYTGSSLVRTGIFYMGFCYWPNSFMKGDEGDIFSKLLDWKSLFGSR